MSDSIKTGILLEIDTTGTEEGAIEFTRGLARVIANFTRKIVESQSEPVDIIVSTVPLHRVCEAARHSMPIAIATLPESEHQA